MFQLLTIPLSYSECPNLHCSRLQCHSYSQCPVAHNAPIDYSAPSYSDSVHTVPQLLTMLVIHSASSYSQCPKLLSMTHYSHCPTTSRAFNYSYRCHSSSWKLRSALAISPHSMSRIRLLHPTSTSHLQSLPLTFSFCAHHLPGEEMAPGWEECSAKAKHCC